MKNIVRIIPLLVFELSTVNISRGQTFIDFFPYSQGFAFVGGAGNDFPSSGDGSEFFNQSTTVRTFTSGTTGGVQKSANPTGITLLLSGTNTPRVLLRMNLSGKVLDGSENLVLRLDKTTANTRIVRLKVEYGTDTTNFTEFANTSIYRTDESPTAQLKTIPIRSNLADAAALDNKSTVFFRMSSVDVSGSGSRPGILIDSIAVNGGVLPVELLSFGGIVAGRTVELLWMTATEVNNYGFEVERNGDFVVELCPSESGVNDAARVGVFSSQNSKGWRTMGFVNGAGTTAAPHSYRFVDVVPAGGVYRYRLRQIDRDGKFQYSRPISLAAALTKDEMRLSQNYPNPFNPTTRIRFGVKKSQHVTLKVYNCLGQEVGTLFDRTAVAETIYDLVFNAGGLPAGPYFYLLRSPERLEIRKMLLLQ